MVTFPFSCFSSYSAEWWGRELVSLDKRISLLLPSDRCAIIRSYGIENSMDIPNLPVTFHEAFKGLSWSITLQTQISIYDVRRTKQKWTYVGRSSTQHRTASVRPRNDLWLFTLPAVREIFDLKWNDFFGKSIRTSDPKYWHQFSLLYSGKDRANLSLKCCLECSLVLWSGNNIVFKLHTVYLVWIGVTLLEDWVAVLKTCWRTRLGGGWDDDGWTQITVSGEGPRSKFGEAWTTPLSANHSSIKLSPRVRASCSHQIIHSVTKSISVRLEAGCCVLLCGWTETII